VEDIIDFLEFARIGKVPADRLPPGLQQRVELARALGMDLYCLTNRRRV
jgi:ABC-type branched-subunit amino acid transport system ATPase component